MAQWQIDVVKRQLAAMGEPRYEIGIRSANGKMQQREWTPAQVIKSIGFLAARNIDGAHIYVRSSGDGSRGLVLVDDLDGEALARMARDGVALACVTETSPGNHQAWIRLWTGDARDESESHLVTRIARALAVRYGGDRASADWRHFGRLAAFSNRKPEHENGGRWPLVRLVSDTGRGVDAATLENLVTTAWNEDRAESYAADLDGVRARWGGGRSNGARAFAKKIYRNVERRVAEDPDFGRSEADFLVAMRMLAAKFSLAAISDAMAAESPGVAARKLGHLEDYVRRTVDQALKAHLA